ncbi:unnamed protein product [Tilletia controversa]|nr:unnamed protein product [Tilletia controversa]
MKRPPWRLRSPSLEVAFETVKHVPGGKASSRTFPPSHTTAAGSQCDFCGAIMPAKFLSNHSCDAKPRVKVEGGGVKVEGASSSKATNEIIEISSDEHSDAEPDAEGAEGAGPLSRKIAAVEAKAKKDKKYHSECLEVVAQDGLRHEKPRAGKAWRCAVCKLTGLIPKKP